MENGGFFLGYLRRFLRLNNRSRFLQIFERRAVGQGISGQYFFQVLAE
jgi:hypothetical protein